MPEFPLPLRHSLESGQCVLFLGAGIGAHLHSADGKPAPDGDTLAAEMAAQFGVDYDGTSNLAKISEFVEITKGRLEVETFLRKRLGGLEPDEHLRWLASIRWKAIYTTNYDEGIERCYALTANPPQHPIPVTLTSELVPHDPRFDVLVYHLHGALFGAPKAQLVLTQGDYARFREGRKMLFELLKADFATATLLYVGYSNRDPNWQMVLDEIASEFYPSPSNPHRQFNVKSIVGHQPMIAADRLNHSHDTIDGGIIELWFERPKISNKALRLSCRDSASLLTY